LENDLQEQVADENMPDTVSLIDEMCSVDPDL
jgi:hypothetical protein